MQRKRDQIKKSQSNLKFVLLIFLLHLALAEIFSAERSIKETKNAPFYAHSGNEPFIQHCFQKLYAEKKGDEKKKFAKNL